MPDSKTPEPPSNSSSSSSTSAPQHSSYFTYPVSYAVNGLLRRLSTEPSKATASSFSPLVGTASYLTQSLASLASTTTSTATNMMDSVFAPPPHRKPSPFQPPPLTPLTLKGYKSSTKESGRLLSKALAEEIRLLVPPRLQLVDEWSVVYSLEQNGVSLATLYQKAEEYRGQRGGFVLVVKDGGGGVFGAYLSDAPKPSPHFFGNGECFLWRAHVLPSVPDLSSLPPPPSADTTHAVRMTTIASPTAFTFPKSGTLSPPQSQKPSRSGTSSPERIRFKAFPYSGVNDYMIFCEQSFLSVGGGDGHYGLWLDDNLENGVSETCPTFGNERLSDEGKKFEVLGVELWYIGSIS